MLAAIAAKAFLPKKYRPNFIAVSSSLFVIGAFDAPA